MYHRRFLWHKWNGDVVDLSASFEHEFDATVWFYQTMIRYENQGWTPPRFWQWWRWGDTK